MMSSRDRPALRGKVAVVTGSGQGIGRGIALALAREGAKVVVSDVTDKIYEVAKEIESVDSQALAIKADVSSPPQVEKMVEETIGKFGRIDILVNNAGIYPNKPLVGITESDWDKVLDVNLKGVFNCTRATASWMMKQKSGKIVNISSIAGTVVGFVGLAHYSASKSGIAGFTKAVALELASFGINVNAVAPGSIETPGARAAGGSQEALEQFIQTIPLKRIGQTEDVANAVLFLVSDESSYVTGHCLVVDGGYTLQ